MHKRTTGFASGEEKAEAVDKKVPRQMKVQVFQPNPNVEEIFSMVFIRALEQTPAAGPDGLGGPFILYRKPAAISGPSAKTGRSGSSRCPATAAIPVSA